MPSTDRDELREKFVGTLMEVYGYKLSVAEDWDNKADQFMQSVDALITLKQKEARIDELDYAINLLFEHDSSRTLAGEIVALQDRILRLQSPHREEDKR